MAKTSDAVSNACARVEIQPGCTGSWYNVGGESTTVTVPKSTRATGSKAVFNDQRHVVTGGKQPPITVVISGVYTENPAEAYMLVRDVWETPGVSDCDKPMCARWIPQGGTPGDLVYTATGQLTGFQYPPLDAGSADPIPFEFDIFGYVDSDVYVS